jgi:mannosyltransferase
MLAILAQAGSVFVVRKRVPIRAFVAASAGIALLLVPLATTLLVHRQRGQIEWITSPRLRQLPGLFVWFVGSWPVAALFAAAGLVALASAVGDWRRERSAPRLWRYVLLLGWLAFPPLAAFAISFAQPVYLYRYFLISLPALVIFVAAGLARIRRLWLLVPAVAAAVALSTYETAACTPGCVIGQDDWRSAAAHIEAHARPGDGIIFSPGELRTPFVHYLQPSQRPQLVYPARWLLEGGPAEGAPTLARAIAVARSHPRIWLVSWWLPAGDVPTQLARGRGGPTVLDFAGNVQLLLYGPPRR